MDNRATDWPCQSPPWGELFAINVNTGDVAWRVPFGRVESLEKIGVMNTGSYNIGGAGWAGSGPLLLWGPAAERFPPPRVPTREAPVGNKAARERIRESDHLFG